jgi:hypothetical protein
MGMAEGIVMAAARATRTMDTLEGLTMMKELGRHGAGARIMTVRLEWADQRMRNSTYMRGTGATATIAGRWTDFKQTEVLSIVEGYQS